MKILYFTNFRFINKLETAATFGTLPSTGWRCGGPRISGAYSRLIRPNIIICYLMLSDGYQGSKLVANREGREGGREGVI